MSTLDTLAKIGRGPGDSEDMSQGEARALFADMLAGRIPPVRLGALLMALRWKGESADELSGFSHALGERTRSVKPPPGTRCVAIIPSYSPLHRQPNLMPGLALRLSSHGVPVLIHGHDTPNGGPPSFQVLARLGHAPVRSVEEAETELAVRNVAVVPTQLLAPELAELLDLRQELGLRHIGHVVARLLDPCPSTSLRLICLSDYATLDRVADTLRSTRGNALLMRATDGESYANPERRPRIVWLREGSAEVLYEEEHGPSQPRPPELDPDDDDAVAAWLRRMLEGKRPLPAPLASQLAACLYASGTTADLAHAKAVVALGALRR